MTEQPEEVEAALFIRSAAASAVADEIAQLDTLGGYLLHRGPDEHIRDVHFDSPDYPLRARGIALRARQKNGRRLITLKGPMRRLDNGSISRTEVERPWTFDGVKQVAEILAEMHIVVPALPAALGDGNPAEVLKRAGFAVLKSRATERRVRNILKTSSQAVLAELAIDAVRYELDQGDAAFFEVEIEAKSAEAYDVVPHCMGALQGTFQHALRPWPYGKLATGSAIAALLHSVSPAGLLDRDRNITPEGCDAVEIYLRGIA